MPFKRTDGRRPPAASGPQSFDSRILCEALCHLLSNSGGAVAMGVKLLVRAIVSTFFMLVVSFPSPSDASCISVVGSYQTTLPDKSCSMVGLRPGGGAPFLSLFKSFLVLVEVFVVELVLVVRVTVDVGLRCVTGVGGSATLLDQTAQPLVVFGLVHLRGPLIAGALRPLTQQKAVGKRTIAAMYT